MRIERIVIPVEIERLVATKRDFDRNKEEKVVPSTASKVARLTSKKDQEFLFTKCIEFKLKKSEVIGIVQRFSRSQKTLEEVIKEFLARRPCQVSRPLYIGQIDEPSEPDSP